MDNYFAEAVDAALGAVMFENWLRFYFIRETGGQPTLQVPESGMRLIAERYPDFLSLAEMVNGRKVEFDTSRRAVCQFAIEAIDRLAAENGSETDGDPAGAVFESHDFQTRLQRFNTWLSGSQGRLDERFLEFGRWRDMFAVWEASLPDNRRGACRP